MKPAYYLQDNGQFVIENYHFSKAFSSFLPGISGVLGKPLWCFYVNRGQAICSFGVEKRDNMILEFLPADQAYQRTSQSGFRTFIKSLSNHQMTYEPFRNSTASFINQKMKISSYDLTLEEDNSILGLNTSINFFTLPGESFPALMRSVTITNTSDNHQSLELLDGLPKVMGFGMNEFFCKNMSRTSEAWMGVKNLEEGHVPFFQLKVLPLDEARVEFLNPGNFYLGFDDHGIIKPIVDPTTIFGQNLDFSTPDIFFNDPNFSFPQHQITESKTPCSFIHYRMDLQPGECKTIYQIVGQVPSLECLRIKTPALAVSGYFQRKRLENKNTVNTIQQNVATVTNSRAFDYYTGQTYLDNVLRGGLPLTIAKEIGKSVVFYTYSRKHGDLERDYNQYQLAPTYYSQGNGNYRDVNQNRRSDVFFNSDLLEENIVHMLNLIQLDGYNPLVMKGVTYLLSTPKKAYLGRVFKKLKQENYKRFFKKMFSPGELMELLECDVTDPSERQEIFEKVLLESTPHQEAIHHEGYWTDHWTYNLDLIESFLSIYPDRLHTLLFDLKRFTFYDDAYMVLTRKDRLMQDDQRARQGRFICHSDEKEKLISKRPVYPHTVRTKQGKGDIYTTSLLVKLFHLVLVKSATLDPFGVGIEMEAGKPNWYDAINGLPALFGSTTTESFELLRLAKFLIQKLTPFRSEVVTLPAELKTFYDGMSDLLTKYPKMANRDVAYWDISNTLKETFRKETFLGLSGDEAEVKVREIVSFCDKLVERLSETLLKAVDPETGVFYTYFTNIPTNIQDDPKTGEAVIKTFKQCPLPLFLEGPVHYLRLLESTEQAAAQYEAIKKSDLYDPKLKMYKVTSSLANEPIEIGRNKIFTPGWLENESVWLHMEYKYLLELLRSGLYQEFDQTFREILIAFQQPEQYGRSILESSSFIVSSANPDPTLHGQGFVARLSGSTAEFINIWIGMFFGLTPFSVDKKGQLILCLNPTLPGWMFLQQDRDVELKVPSGTFLPFTLPRGAAMASFLGSIPVIYYNPSFRDTWNCPIESIVIHPTGKTAYSITGNRIANAEFIRDKKVDYIEVYFEEQA